MPPPTLRENANHYAFNTNLKLTFYCTVHSDFFTQSWMRFTHTKIENIFYALYSVRFFVKKSFLEKKNTVKCVLFGVRICLENL